MKCVYKIVCKDKEITEFYIGSSLDFDKRKQKHESDSNNLNGIQYCSPLYMFINVNGGYDNWKYEVIKEFPNHNKKQLNIEEQKYMDLLKPTLNSHNANGLDIERKKNTDKKHHKISNKIKSNCDICGKEMFRSNIKRHKRNKHPTN